ncbi:hypothetical protein BJ170DRAFT_221359 [Xylariales sp. AK1849]|nr:hypothetical protein BJ170DRAFT_221359 [Xylariales sp. AK1849]
MRAMLDAEPSVLPISSLLTVIITTSVTPSAPSTDLLSLIIDGFRRHCAALLDCRLIVVLDSHDQIVSQARLKKGQVTAEQARHVATYRDNVKALILEQFHGAKGDVAFIQHEGQAEYGSHRIAANVVTFTATQTQDGRLIFIEPSRRLGFGLAVRSALRLTETPYVWVQQHDWSLTADIPVESMLHVMEASESDPAVPVKYICLPAVRMLSYATSADVVPFPELKQLTSTLKRHFLTPTREESKIPLTPLFFWHDKPHVASTAHYLSRVFPTRLAMLRGDFIEDKIGQRARAQMKEGLWPKWATWLYYPDEGKQLCLRHLKGRTWLGMEGQSNHDATYREHNLEELRKDKPCANRGPDNLDIGVLGELF